MSGATPSAGGTRETGGAGLAADPGSPRRSTSSLQGLIPAPASEELRELAEALVRAGDGSIAAILLYGSRVQNSHPDRWSAYDFMVVVDSYSRFFRSFCAAGYHGKSPLLLTTLSYFLPPNIVSFRLPGADQPPAKCALVNGRHFRRSLGPRSPDHFLKGRVVQKLAMVWTRGPEDEALVIAALRRAREGIVGWVRPYLAGDFDLEQFAETMLRVSYRGEIRPESPERVEQVFASQREILTAIAGESLAAAVARGEILSAPGGYRWKRTPGRMLRWAYSLYFFGSKARATARWFKYMVTFEGWMEYIVRKINRRAGFEVDVTERERRWPLIFLWPKLFRVLAAVKAADAPMPVDEKREAE